MEPERRKQILLVVLLLVLAAIASARLWSGPSGGRAAASNGRAAATAGSRGAQAATAPKVALDALAADRPAPITGERNLFRFKPKAAPAPSGAPAGGPASAGAPQPGAAPGPAAPPPISNTLKFAGLVEAPASGERIAIFSDGRKVYYGREGDIILGQYRILRIGAESVEMSYLDGRGRQVIRLTGR